MTQKQLATLAVAAGVIVLLSMWGRVSDWTEALLRQEEVRGKKVVYWTSSGSPEVDLKRARQFEQQYPEINIEPNFRESGGLQDILFVSFLSGNPPDYMGAKRNELRKYVLMGGLRPLDDLLAAENQRLAKEGKDYFDQFQFGKARIFRFNVNPDDRFVREMERYPKEAARLLAMNGRAIGIRDVSMPATLTYNKRLFREAAKMFPGAALVDEHGEPIPPATWLEFYEKARVLTEYGRRAAKDRGLKEPVCYGVVLQGQRTRDIIRGIGPLAYRAGSMAFAFEGDTRTVHEYFNAETEAGRKAREKYAGKAIGYFNWEHDAFLGAFALLLKMKQDGFVLPGTEARHYEDVRTALASGNAAMVVDGWHAALIGAERVPWAAQDLGSAPIPVPYHEVDEETGWTRAKVEAEKESLDRLLSLEKAGVRLVGGNRLPRTANDDILFLTALCRDPDAAWEWVHFVTRSEEALKTECRRGIVRMESVAMAHLGDPEWFPYPYQAQVYDIIERHCEMWPEKPLYGPTRVPSERDVFFKYFHQTDLTDMVEILTKAREQVAAYSQATNRDLARRIEDGIVRPEAWTFKDWDAKRAQRFFERQQDLSKEKHVERQLEEAEQRLKAHAGRHPELNLLDGDGNIREGIWQFEPPDTTAQVIWIPVLMFGVAAGWLLVIALRGLVARRPVLRDTLRGARRGWHGYVFVFPGMLAIFAFAIYPSLYQFYLAAHSGDGLGAMQYVGWENFARILDFTSADFDTVFWAKVVPNTFLYMLFVTFGTIALGLLVASLLNMPLRANKVYRVLFFIPLVTSLAIVSVILIGLLKGEHSGVNEFLSAVGLENLPYWLGLVREEGEAFDWLGQKAGLWTVMAVGIWHGLPYNIILLLAGLQSISPAQYEAAKVDGANAWQRFWHVTIPEILPILIVICFAAFIGAARAFSVVFVLTEGGIEHSSELVATYIFKWGFMKPEGQEANLGYASALGIVYSVMLATLTFTNVAIIARRWKRRLQTERAAGRPR